MAHLIDCCIYSYNGQANPDPRLSLRLRILKLSCKNTRRDPPRINGWGQQCGGSALGKVGKWKSRSSRIKKKKQFR